MSDHELLMLAAKAAGLSVYFYGNGRCRHWDKEKYWEPLTDDGDALRLAVKLHIDIRHFMFERGFMDCLVDRLGKCLRETLGDDPDAATRRAIVRAAAEIGKAMP